ncbi:MAG TPA: TlpA disulfide reductase family protein [Thermodesulfovibrionales bacterium]|nr:TlpA disulfide reductase family protein [Thermodesulfovibrionales bacterium]
MSLVIISFLAASCSKAPETFEKVAEPGKAPDFNLRDLQGRALALSSLRGKVVILEFWATWCPPCRESVPELNGIYKKYKGKNFELLGIAIDKGKNAPSEVSEFVKKHVVIYPVLVDDKDVNSAYEVSGIPAMFVIDKEGKVVKSLAGYIPGIGEALSKEVDALL